MFERPRRSGRNRTLPEGSSIEPSQPPSDPEFELRLLVVKIEGLLVPPPEAWADSLVDAPGDPFEAHELFPGWARSLGLPPATLRKRLASLAGEADWELAEGLRGFLDSVYGHSPLRVAYLTGGPREWARGLAERLELKQRGDLIYHYDRYPHGTRRTLLKFLMNRFIAGRARTMLLGDHPADERLAHREGARFRSPRRAPEDARNPDHWDRDYDRLAGELERLRTES